MNLNRTVGGGGSEVGSRQEVVASPVSEILGPGRALDDFQVDAEGDGVLDEVLAVAAVDPDLADARGGWRHTWSGNAQRVSDIPGIGTTLSHDLGVVAEQS